jgi:Family of unknown function (DUF6400)
MCGNHTRLDCGRAGYLPGMDATTPINLHPGPAAELLPFTMALAADEVRRVGAVLDAMPDWDPAAVLAAETEAHAMLYSGLDAEQRTVHALLCEAGVLDA